MNDSSASGPPEVAVYRHQAEIIHERVRQNMAGFSHEDSLAQPEPAGHSANWILGHLIEIYERALDKLGQQRIFPEEALERYRQGTPLQEEPSQALQLPQLLEAWDEASKRFDAGLRELTAQELNRSDWYFEKRPEPTTLRRYLDMFLFHQAYHSGQLGLLRRLVGKEGAVP